MRCPVMLRLLPSHQRLLLLHQHDLHLSLCSEGGGGSRDAARRSGSSSSRSEPSAIHSRCAGGLPSSSSSGAHVEHHLGRGAATCRPVLGSGGLHDGCAVWRPAAGQHAGHQVAGRRGASGRSCPLLRRQPGNPLLHGVLEGSGSSSGSCGSAGGSRCSHCLLRGLLVAIVEVAVLLPPCSHVVEGGGVVPFGLVNGPECPLAHLLHEAVVLLVDALHLGLVALVEVVHVLLDLLPDLAPLPCRHYFDARRVLRHRIQGGRGLQHRRADVPVLLDNAVEAAEELRRGLHQGVPCQAGNAHSGGGGCGDGRRVGEWRRRGRGKGLRRPLRSGGGDTRARGRCGCGGWRRGARRVLLDGSCRELRLTSAVGASAVVALALGLCEDGGLHAGRILRCKL
mmetsp:Transcript_27970/g.79106  ORF Transcript_27970/g.79106 Transcript_27970/m.79106 type:complete len:396 (+) Transcript_27970:1315-2502(+)